MEAISQAISVDKIGDGKHFTLDGERTRRIPTGGTDRTAL